MMFVPAQVAGQVCVGGGVHGSAGVALASVLSSNQDMRGYGLQVSARPGGPVWAESAVSLINLDDVADHLIAWSARAGGETRVGGVNLCPGAGVEFGRLDAESPFGDSFRTRERLVPLFVGIGRALDVGDGVVLTPYLVPQVFFSRLEFTLLDADGAVIEREVSDSTEGAFVLGAQVRQGIFFGGAGWQLSTVDGAAPVISLHVGLALQRESGS